MFDLRGTRVLVTGGQGFLGGFLCALLRERGAAEVFAPRSREFDLVDREAVRRLLKETRPDLVFHLAARVGGIGANQKNPARFLFENGMMALHLFEECHLAK